MTVKVSGKREADRALAAFVTELGTDKVRTAGSFGELLEKWFAARSATDGFVFAVQPDGSRPVRPDHLDASLLRLRDGLGLDRVRLHDLRHFVATTLLAAGVDLATVAGRLGHGGGGKTTLAVYAHFLEGGASDRAAAELLAQIPSPAPAPEATTHAEVIPLRRAQGDRGI